MPCCVLCCTYYFCTCQVSFNYTGIRTHALQAQKRTVYTLDHKVTVTLWSIVDSPICFADFSSCFSIFFLKLSCFLRMSNVVSANTILNLVAILLNFVRCGTVRCCALLRALLYVLFLYMPGIIRSIVSYQVPVLLLTSHHFCWYFYRTYS